MRIRIYLVLWAAALGVGFVPGARGAPIYSTLGPGGAFDTNHSVQIGFGSIVPRPTVGAYADEFTCPVTATVGPVSLALAAPGIIPAAALPDTSSFNISIRAIAPIGPRGPTNIVGTFGPGNVTQAGIYTFNSTTAFQLDAGTEYWLFVGDTSLPIYWFFNDQGINNVTGSRSGGTWTVNGTGTALAFELDTVPEPDSAALCATTFALAYLSRKQTALSRK